MKPDAPQPKATLGQAHQPVFRQRWLWLGALVSSLVMVGGLMLYGVNDERAGLTSAAVLTFLTALTLGQLARQRFRVSLRTLLIIMAVLAIGFAYIGRELDTYRREQAALDVIVKSYGSVDFRETGETRGKWFYTSGGWPIPLWVKENLFGDNFFATIDTLNVDSFELDPEWMSALSELRYVEQLNLPDVLAMDADDLAAMPLIPGLQSLEIDASQFSPAAAARLALQSNLQRLAIRGHSLTEEQCRSLGQLAQLRELALYPQRLSPGACRELADLPTLRVLKLDETYGKLFRMPSPLKWELMRDLSKSKSIECLELCRAFLGEGVLRPLHSMPQLERLVLDGCSYFPKDLAEFRAARPDVEVVR